MRSDKYKLLLVVGISDSLGCIKNITQEIEVVPNNKTSVEMKVRFEEIFKRQLVTVDKDSIVIFKNNLE